jgi:ribosomal protein S1
MATELPTTNENNFAVKAGLARMLKGGVIMDVVNAEQVRQFLPRPVFENLRLKARSWRGMAA